jgi:hypothetical protein
VPPGCPARRGGRARGSKKNDGPFPQTPRPARSSLGQAKESAAYGRLFGWMQELTRAAPARRLRPARRGVLSRVTACSPLAWPFRPQFARPGVLSVRGSFARIKPLPAVDPASPHITLPYPII